MEEQQPHFKHHIIFNKKEKYTLAAKGGHNDEPHNHNDLGSFVVFADGKYIVDDLGWPEYDKNYFNKAVRYENYICASSFGHSVPIIDGKGQLYGKDKRAKVISAENNEFYIDLSLAYGLNEGSVKRRVKAFCGEVLLTDYVKGDHDIISRIALRLEPKLLENGVKVGESLIIADVPCEIKISTKEFETRYSVAVSDTGRFVTAYFVDFIPKERTEEITLRIKI